MRLFLFAVALSIAILGCSDGKLNLLLVFWGGDEEEPSSSSIVEHQSSSSSAKILSSSSLETPQYSSGEEPALSSSEAPSLSSSSEETSPPSSSSSSSRAAVRYSSSKEYIDYPILIEGAENVTPGWATRYWDGCKPHCSWLGNIIDKDPSKRKPWSGICKNCDINNKEVTTYERHPEWTDGLWWAGYLSIPNSCQKNRSTEFYTYTCWDMAPIAINDTLAYGFAAVSPEMAECGACYQLVFDGYWYDEPELTRATHRAVKGKTMIVMASNIGPEVRSNVQMKNGKIGSQFDIMIPGGGVGKNNAISEQIDGELGGGDGGLLTNCLNNGINEILGDSIRDGSHRATLEQWQRCLRIECNRLFGNDKYKTLLNGCLWHADWFMAADNPTLHYTKVECPKYLKDKYYSSIDLEPPPLPDPYPQNGLCMIEGSIDCKQTGWYD